MNIPNQKRKNLIAVMALLTISLVLGGYLWWKDAREKAYPARLKEIKTTLAANKYQDAKNLLAKLKEEYGERTEILELEGSFKVLEGKFASSQESYRKVLEKDPGNIKTRYMLGLTELAGGKLDGARKCAQELADCPEKTFLECLIKIAEKKHKEVLKDMESLATYFDNEYNYHVNMGDVYWKTGDKQKAVASYQKGLKLNDKAWMVSLKLGEIFLAWDKYPAALGFANMSIKSEPGCLPAYRVGGEALFMQKEYAKAQTYCEQILKYAEKNKVANELQGWANYRLGCMALVKAEKQKAQDYLEKAVQLEPEDANYMSRLACVYAMNGKSDQAMKLAEQLVEKNPKTDAGLNLLGQIALTSGDVKVAMKSFEEALTKPGKHTGTKLILAELNIRQKEYRTAYGLLEQVSENDLRTQPQLSVYYHFKRGFILDVLGGREKFAKEEYEKCLKADPKCVGAMGNLARLLAKDKASVKEAAQYAEKAVEMKPESGDLQEILGRVYYADGQFEKSITALKKARELDKDAPVAYLLGMALKQTGKKEEAIKELTPLLDKTDFTQKDEVRKTLEDLRGTATPK